MTCRGERGARDLGVAARWLPVLASAHGAPHRGARGLGWSLTHPNPLSSCRLPQSLLPSCWPLLSSGGGVKVCGHGLCGHRSLDPGLMQFASQGCCVMLASDLTSLCYSQKQQLHAAMASSTQHSG